MCAQSPGGRSSSSGRTFGFILPKRPVGMRSDVLKVTSARDKKS